jgi:hypothetical protein
VPHQLPQLPGHRRRDPRLRQPTQTEQVGQAGRIPDVVLNPAILESLRPQRMRQMRVSATGPQRIHRPVPPVSRLEHHLRILTDPPHHAVKPVDIVEDPHGLQDVSALGSPNDHTPTAIQIDTHKLPPRTL